MKIEIDDITGNHMAVSEKCGLNAKKGALNWR